MTCCRKKIDAAQVRQEASELAEVLVEHAERAAEWASPRLAKAREEAVRAAKEAQVKAQPVVDEARTRLVEDYIPRAQRVAAASQEAAAAEGTLSERAQRVAVAAKNAALEVPVKKKSHKVLKTLGWLTVAGAAGCAAYVLWRRSQPVEDPWAEEYWEDSEESLGEAGEAVSEKVEEAVDAAQEKVDDVVGAAEDKLGD